MNGKEIEIDISGRIDQKSYNSIVVMLSKDKTIENSVFLQSELKREIINRNKEIKNIVEMIHCILIYYCIKDFILKISKIQICPDCSPKKIDQYLNFYFKDIPDFKRIKKKIKGIKHSSFCHKKAIRIFRGKEEAKINITKEMIMNLLNKNARRKNECKG